MQNAIAFLEFPGLLNTTQLASTPPDLYTPARHSNLMLTQNSLLFLTLPGSHERHAMQIKTQNQIISGMTMNLRRPMLSYVSCMISPVVVCIKSLYADGPMQVLLINFPFIGRSLWRPT